MIHVIYLSLNYHIKIDKNMLLTLIVLYVSHILHDMILVKKYIIFVYIHIQ